MREKCSMIEAAAWRKSTRGLWREHQRAENAMIRIFGEKPRCPWHWLRQARAMAEYERKFYAIPMPPAEEVEQ